MFPSEGLPLLSLHVSPGLQITRNSLVKPSSLLYRGEALLLPFVSDEHDDHVAVAVLPGVLQPGGQVVECVSASDVIDQESSRSSSVV